MGKDIRIIVCAALKNKSTGLIICGARHFDMVMHHVIDALKVKPHPSDWDQGFIDQYGDYHTREEAAQIVHNNSQWVRTAPDEVLYSENIY